MKNKLQQLLLLIPLCLFLIPSSYSQTTIWEENFTGLADGTTTDAGATAWTKNADNGSVQANRFEASNIGGGNETVWTSQVIDITGYTNVSLEAFLQSEATGAAEFETPQDYFQIYYRLDGGAEILFATNGTHAGSINSQTGNASNGTQNATASQTGLNGTSVQIIVRMRNSEPPEIYRFDDVIVRGTPITNPATCGGTTNPFWNEEFSLANGTDSDNGTTAWSESGNAGAGEVNGGGYEWNNVAPQGVWTTGTINISGLTGVVVSMDVSETGGLEPADRLIVEYSTDDEVSWTEFFNQTDDFANQTVTANVPPNTQLKIRVRALNSSTGETYRIDNVRVSCVTNTTGGGGIDPNCIPPLAPPTFTEVAATTGGLNVGGNKDGGTAWGDFNQNGCLDLLVNTQDDGTQLFQSNCDGTFFRVPNTRVPAEMGTLRRERSVIWGDINNDGWLDFARNTSATGNNDASIHFYLNEGNPPNNSFILIQTVCDGSDNGDIGGGAVNPAQQNEINNGRLVDGQNTEGLGWLDYNNDGFLDLVIENHNHGIDILENQFFRGAANVLTVVPQNVDCNHNSNPPTDYPPFMHVTPDEDPKGLITGATDGDYMTIGDYNNDGYLDILGRKNNDFDLFQNNGNNNFPENTTFNGQASNNNKGGVMFCDFDNDGDFDIMWTANDNPTAGNENFIWMQTGLYSGVFEKLDGTAGKPNPIAGIPTDDSNNNDGTNEAIDGCACGDIDNDGDMDMFLSDDVGASYLFINQFMETGLVGGYPTFIRNNYGINVNGNGEGVNLVDYDNDGDLDLYVNVRNGNNQLWRNDLPCPKNNMKVEALMCIEPGLYREAVGTTIRIEDMTGTFSSGLQDVNAAKGHGSQNPLKVPFGIPDNNGLYKIIVRFPPFNIDLDGNGIIQNPNGAGNNETISETYTIENIRPTDFPNQTVRITSRFAVNGGVDCNGGLLPVEMLYFTGEQLVSGENLLKWGTAWERDNDKFVVERSFDGTNFEAVGERKAKSENSVLVTVYEFLDREITQELQKNSTKTVYYRLRQIDTNGTISFSKTVSIAITNSDLISNTSNLIYPSPNKKSNDFMLDYEAIKSNQKFDLKIYNVIGQLVYQKKYKLKKGMNKLIIPTKNLPRGILIAKWTTINESNSQKIVLE